MLAYGASKRTLRFSYHLNTQPEDIGSNDLVRGGGCFSAGLSNLGTPLEFSDENSPRLGAIRQERKDRQLAAIITPRKLLEENDDDDDPNEGTIPMKATSSGTSGWRGTTKSGGKNSAGVPMRGSGILPTGTRPQFRLQMDLGSISDDGNSSGDDGEWGTGRISGDWRRAGTGGVVGNNDRFGGGGDERSGGAASKGIQKELIHGGGDPHYDVHCRSSARDCGDNGRSLGTCSDGGRSDSPFSRKTEVHW